MTMFREILEQNTKLVVLKAPMGYGVRVSTASHLALFGVRITLVTPPVRKSSWLKDFSDAGVPPSMVTTCAARKFLGGSSEVSGVVVIDAIFNDRKMYSKVMQRVIDVLPETSLVVVLV